MPDGSRCQRLVLAARSRDTGVNRFIHMSSISGKTVIVTGGAGFIGSHLVERLLGEGERVVVIDDCSTGSLKNLAAVEHDPHLTVIRSKVSACQELPSLLREAKAVYHLAATVGVDLVMRSGIETIRNNLDETTAILEAASHHGVRLLLASTSEVYGKSAKAEFSEEDDLLIGPPHLHRWSYACSKLMDEFLSLAYGKERGLPVVIARLFNTVGPRQSGKYGMVLPRFVEAALQDKPLRIHGDGSQTRCFCHVGDTVEALHRLMNSPQALGQVFNIGNPGEVTIRQLAELVIRLLRSRSGVELIPYDKAYPAGFEDMQRRRPSIAKLAKTTGFIPATPLEKIIGEIAGK
jgi:UDP-glucose 4-epimerase